MSLYWAVLAMMTALVPSEAPVFRHGELAVAIAEVCVDEGDLYSEDPSHLKTASLLVAVAFRESSLDNRAVGDNGKSFCAMQIHSSSGGTAILLEDARLCVRSAHRILKQSIRIDRTHPIAFYARGPRFRSVEAQRISNDRVAIARSILAELE